MARIEDDLHSLFVQNISSWSTTSADHGRLVLHLIFAFGGKHPRSNADGDDDEEADEDAPPVAASSLAGLSVAWYEDWKKRDEPVSHFDDRGDLVVGEMIANSRKAVSSKLER